MKVLTFVDSSLTFTGDRRRDNILDEGLSGLGTFLIVTGCYHVPPGTLQRVHEDSKKTTSTAMTGDPETNQTMSDTRELPGVTVTERGR